MAEPRPAVAAHNTAQRRYFEERPLPRMAPDDTPYLNRQVDVALAALGLEAGARVAEVGCGMGRYTFLLARRGLRVEGIDLSPVLLERLARHDGGRHGIPLHAADLQNLPDALAGRFDAVVGFFMLHHIRDLAGCFAGVARLLRPGGRAAFVEPNPLNGLYYLQIALSPGMTWAGDRGILDMRPGKVARAMRAGGLAAPRASRFGFLPPFVANRPWGARLERGLERVAPLRPLSAFQLFQAAKR
jgi:SAM-dependent methyltransferase